jgi:DNA repair exonuclease SbcCD ATPase subunit
LSTLTKVLIVLLTVFSLFLCGIVVTYVSNAENQRKRADTLQQQLQSARKTQETAVANEEKAKQESAAEKAKLDDQLAQLTTLRTQLEGEIDTLKRDNGQKDKDAMGAHAKAAMATELASKSNDQAAAAETEVKSLQTKVSNLEKELQETTQALMERVAVLTDMEKRNRQLVEEKQGLETQLSQVLQQYGRAPLRTQTVTNPVGIAQPVQRAVAQQPTAVAATRAINLNGRVTQVDMKNKVAAISIGAAAGVRGEMKFHVTRGDRFICDILIFDVDPEKAVGTLDLVQAEPQVGDTIATNL